MNLQFLEATLPKNLDLQANSVTSKRNYGYTTVSDVKTTPVTLDAETFVNGTVYAHDSVGTINLPNAAALNAYLGDVKEGFYFRTDMAKSSAVSYTIQFGTGVTEFRAGASSITFNTLSNTWNNLKYVYQADGTWIVYW